MNELGVGPKDGADTDFKVPLSDPRIVEAGLNPDDYLGKGLTYQELNRRLEAKKKPLSNTRKQR